MLSPGRAVLTVTITSALFSACGDPPAPLAPDARAALDAAALADTQLEAGVPIYGLGGLRGATPQSPCAEGAYRQFDFWLGGWSVVPNVSPTPTGPGTPSRITTALDGCALLEAWGGGGRS